MTRPTTYTARLLAALALAGVLVAGCTGPGLEPPKRGDNAGAAGIGSLDGGSGPDVAAGGRGAQTEDAGEVVPPLGGASGMDADEDAGTPADAGMHDDEDGGALQ